MVKLVVWFTHASATGDFDRRLARSVELLRLMPGARRVQAGAVLGSPSHEALYARVVEVAFETFAALDAALTAPEGVAAGKDLMSFAPDSLLLFVEMADDAQPAGPLTPSNLQAYLDEFSIQAEIVHPGVPTPTVPAAARALGVEPDQIVKTVIFLLAGRPFVVYACGTRRVDAGRLADRLGVSRDAIKLANPDEVLALSGYQVGTVPPLGLKTPMPAYMDPAVLAHDVIYAGGGGIDALLRMSPEALLRASRAEVAPLLEADQNAAPAES